MITQISEEIYLVSFNDKDGYLHLRTFNISDNGSIAFTGYEKICADYPVADDPNSPNRPSQQKITDNVCAIVYWGKKSQQKDIGLMKTVRVSSNGAIKFIENITYPSGGWYEPCLIHVLGDVYGLAFRNVSNQGVIKTFHINASGHITPIDEKSYAPVAYQPWLTNVFGNASVFAVAYRDANSYGYIQSVNISSNGLIQLTNKWKIFEKTAGDCFNPYILQVSDTQYVIAYSTGDSTGESYGYFVTLNLMKNGSIGIIDQRKEFEIPEKISSQTRCFNPILLRVSPYVFAITYEGFGDHPGKLLTLLIGKEVRGIYKEGSYQVYANMTAILGKINDVIVSIPNPNPLLWHHVAVTYDGMNVRLYVDGIGVASLPYLHHRINSSTADLFFGRFYCGSIDEVAIYDKALTSIQNQNQFNSPGMLEQYLK